MEIESLRFGYGSAGAVLNGLNLRLVRGERIGLTGANGSGKSTLFQTIVGLLRPEAGSLRVLGECRKTERDFQEVRRHVGFLFQDSDDQLFCPTVGEDVAFGPRNLGFGPEEARARALRALEQVGLAALEDRISYHLSFGEKRLAALAAVLAMDPQVLLLDEPTAGLDEVMEERVATLIEALPQAMIISSHNHPFLARVATRNVRLEDGRVHAIHLSGRADSRPATAG